MPQVARAPVCGLLSPRGMLDWYPAIKLECSRPSLAFSTQLQHAHARERDVQVLVSRVHDDGLRLGGKRDLSCFSTSTLYFTY